MTTVAITLTGNTVFGTSTPSVTDVSDKTITLYIVESGRKHCRLLLISTCVTRGLMTLTKFTAFIKEMVIVATTDTKRKTPISRRLIPIFRLDVPLLFSPSVARCYDLCTTSGSTMSSVMRITETSN